MLDFLVGSYVHSEIQASATTRHLSAEETRKQAFRSLCEFKGVPAARNEEELKECVFDMLTPGQQVWYRNKENARVMAGIVCAILGVLVAAFFSHYELTFLGCVAGTLLGVPVFCICAVLVGPPNLLTIALGEYEHAHRSALKAKCAQIQAAKMAAR